MLSLLRKEIEDDDRDAVNTMGELFLSQLYRDLVINKDTTHEISAK